jgi:hypothetical protein
MLRGVDVSSFQGRPAQWKGQAGRFAWAAVKITELEPSGTRYVNPDAAADWAFLHRQQKMRVAYLFGHPSVSAAHTVSFFLAEMHKLGLHDEQTLALDIEVTDGLGPAAVDAWCVEVTSELRHKTMRHPVVYVPVLRRGGKHQAARPSPLWIADPSSRRGQSAGAAPWKTGPCISTTSPGQSTATWRNSPAGSNGRGAREREGAALEEPGRDEYLRASRRPLGQRRHRGRRDRQGRVHPGHPLGKRQLGLVA